MSKPHDGNLIKGLIDLVKRVTSTDTTRTPSSPAPTDDGFQVTRCPYCKANYGHFGYCPLLNENTAEAFSAMTGDASEADILAAHALGVKLD